MFKYKVYNTYKKRFYSTKCSYTHKSAIKRFSSSIKKIFNYYDDDTKYVIVCIGTDRSTGDSLGPLVGTYLENYKFKNVEILGNLSKPVHAENLVDYLNYIKSKYTENYVVIAIDASLGIKDDVGYIFLKKGSLKPGAGVGKKLPEVGNYYFSAVVNIGGFMEFFVLQSTRLHIVNEMAKVISSSIVDAFSWKEKKRKKKKFVVQE